MVMHHPCWKERNETSKIKDKTQEKELFPFIVKRIKFS